MQNARRISAPAKQLGGVTGHHPIFLRADKPGGAEIIRQDVGLGDSVLTTGDNRVKHKLQADSAVQKARPGDHDLGIHARLESVARAKDDVLTADHPNLAEAVQRSQFGCGFVAHL